MANPLHVGASRFRRRGLLVRVFVVLLAVYAVLSFLIAAITDFWWFDSLAHADTWQRIWSSKFSLLLAGCTIAFITVSLPLLLAERAAPDDALFSRDDPLVGIRSYTAAKPNLSRNVIAGICALIFGPVAMSWWNSFALFRFGLVEDFNEQRGAKGAFGASLGFYMFRLPFLRSVTNWLFSLLLVSLLVLLAALVLNGGIRSDGRRFVVVPSARRLISVMLALLFLVRALGFWFSRYALALSTHERFDGANYVDRHVRSPAYIVMIAASVLCAVVLIANVFRSRWDVMISTVVAWLIVAPVCLLLVPSIWQRFVISNEREREAPSIRAHIDATRAAFQLDAVEERTPKFEPKSAGASEEELRAASDALRATRVWDVNGYTPVSQNVVDSLQKANPRYTIPDVDVIPGQYNGALSPLLVGVREVAIDPATSPWVERHLSLVNGYGVAIAAGNDANRENPKFVLSGIPLAGPYLLNEPRIFFGERTTEFAVIGTRTKPAAIPGLSKQPTSVAGIQGVKVGSGIRRLMLAWRFRDLDLLVSKSITLNSKLLSNREITSRVTDIAPFLSIDSNPYPVIDRGRVVWIVDGYVKSSTYPNADRSPKFSQRTGTAALAGQYSYVRNSIRAVVDAYSGSVRFYRIDLEEPMAKAYARAYPYLFETERVKNAVNDVDFGRDFPEVRSSIRYPSDLFDIRAALWGRVHVTAPDLFFDQGDRWSIGASSAGVLSEKQKLPGGNPVLAPPEYVVAPIGTSRQNEFVLQQSLVARGRRSESSSDQRLRALVFARSDAKHYGQLVSIAVPAGLSYDSAASLGQQFSADPRVSARETSNGLRGSKLINGEMQIVPVGNTLLYVRPVYVSDEGGTLARLTSVTVGIGGKVGFAPTFAEALADIVGTDPLAGSPGIADQPASGGGAVSSATSVEELLAEADRLFAQAQSALKAGDLGTYQKRVDALGKVVAEARAAARTEADGTLSEPSAPTPALPSPLAPPVSPTPLVPSTPTTPTPAGPDPSPTKPTTPRVVLTTS